MEDQPISQFIQAIEQAITSGTFHKLTLSKPNHKNNTLPKNIYGRLVQLKKGLALSCTLRYPTKDITQNYLIGTVLTEQLLQWLGSSYLIATLLTNSQEITLKFNKKRKARLLQNNYKRSITPINTSHDKVKQYLIAPDRPFLQLLGVSSKEGNVLNAQHDKFRQINKYVEIMAQLFQQANWQPSLENPLHIVDMGSGKGYLTFALYDWIMELFQMPVKVLGIELREQLCNFCNAQAQQLGWQEHLRFTAMDILDYTAADIDVLIALHACDTATDIAIAQGIKNKAQLIVVAPCCHKQIRKEMQANLSWPAITRHGILLERQAELITDAIRALLLELNGYQTKVFEFISSEHTTKNIMITAVKRTTALTVEKQEQLTRELQSLKTAWNIQAHYLETLLKGQSIN